MPRDPRFTFDKNHPSQELRSVIVLSKALLFTPLHGRSPRVSISSLCLLMALFACTSKGNEKPPAPAADERAAERHRMVDQYLAKGGIRDQ
ncbi:MAG: hypothetical protein SNJ52_04455, partial [Verrucomicrobiia bacterium]